MDSSTVASRLKQTPRFLTIRSPYQLQLRLHRMTPLQIWTAMTQRGIAGWKHKVMSDELERRKQQAFAETDLLPFIKEFSA